MKKTILAVVAFLAVSPLVFSIETKTFSWIPPDQRIDGTPLANNEIAEYNIFCNDALLATVANDAGTNSWQSGTLPLGVYSCYATAVDLNGLESEASNSVNFTVNPLRPEAPSGFTVILP